MVEAETKTAREILDEIRARGGNIKIEGQNLYVWPSSVVGDGEAEEMRSLKPQIIALLITGEYPFTITEEDDLGFCEIKWSDDRATYSYKAGVLYSNAPYVKAPCFWLTRLDGQKGGLIGIRPDHINELTDEEVVVLMRKSAKAAELQMAAWRVRRVTENLTILCSGLWRIEEFQAAYERDYALLYSHQDEPEIRELLDRFEPIWRGQVPDAGYIYCLSDQQGHYKLGRTTQLQARIKALGTQPPFKIKLLFTHYVFNSPHYEKSLHLHFASKRMNGEWFALSDEDLESIKSGKWAEVYK